MLMREELVETIEEYNNRSMIQSEIDVVTKLVVQLSEWLGYPQKLRYMNLMYMATMQKKNKRQNEQT